MFFSSLYIAGAAHRSQYRPCQDRTAAFSRCYGDVRATVLLVSDGHGHPTHFRSERGAALALDAAREALEPFMAKAGHSAAEDISEALFRELFADILRRWYSKILTDWKNNPPLEPGINPLAQAYGCTLIGAVAYAGGWFAFQLGDGAAVGLDAAGMLEEPVPGDLRCMGSLTTSLCSNGAEDFRYCAGNAAPAVLMLCSDGLENCYGSRAELAGDFLVDVARGIAADGAEATVCRLQTLLPDFSAAGSRDDIGLAFWYDSVRAPQAIAAAATQRLRQLEGELGARGDADDDEAEYMRERIEALREITGHKAGGGE